MKIRDREYTAKFISVLLYERALFSIGKAWEAREARDFETYNKYWLEYCAMQLNEDVSDLALDKITPDEMLEIQGFFGRLQAAVTQKLRAGNETSAGSPNMSGGNSQSGMS